MKKSDTIEVFALAKFQAILTALLGLLAGILYSFGGLIIDTLASLQWVTSTETPGLSYGTFLAFGALIGMPVVFGVFGFFAGIIQAILYNVFVKNFEINNAIIDFKKNIKF